jgi:Flp pilus assembly protein TadG
MLNANNFKRGVAKPFRFFSTHNRQCHQIRPGSKPCRSRGQVLIAVTVALPVLLGMAGLAVDMGRLYTAQSRLQAAVDAAALGGSMYLMTDPDCDNGAVANTVNDYLARNYSGAAVTDLHPGSGVRSVCVTAQANVTMTFMNVLAISSRDVTASACAGFNDLEVALVVDSSGSMAGEPIDAVKAAAHQFVDMLIPNGGAPSIKVGLVGFQGKVRIPADVDGKPAGCRNADGTLNQPVNGSDQSCTDGALAPAAGLSYNKAAIHSAIDSMEPQGGGEYASCTAIPEGIKWGRHVLTSDTPFTEAGSRTRFRKVLILLTDGDNNISDAISNPSSVCRRNAYFGMGVTDCDDDDYGCLDQAMLSQAQAAKDDGIEIFTIRYGVSDEVDIELMKSVASSKSGTEDHYFDAPTLDDLQTIFDRIGRQLGFRLL